MRGNANMREQAFLTVAVQNMKKMASLLWKPLSRSFNSIGLKFYSIWQTPCFRRNVGGVGANNLFWVQTR